MFVVLEMKAECCANSFYNGELELRRIKRLDYSFRKDSDREKCTKLVENYRRENLLDSTAERRARGTLIGTFNQPISFRL